jgi:hypothetical protein
MLQAIMVAAAIGGAAGATRAAGPAAAAGRSGVAAAAKNAPGAPEGNGPWTAQIETMDFKPTADLILRRITANRFSGLATDAGAIVLTPAEREELNRLKAAAEQVQAHPHDVKLAVQMMTDLNRATFLAFYDSQRAKAKNAKGNERTILNFMTDLRDEAANSTSVMEVVNIAGSMDHLINQQAVVNGNMVSTDGKPKPWLSPENEGDKTFIEHLSDVRAAALEALGLAMKGDAVVDVPKTSTAVKTEDGRPLVGLVALKAGELAKGKVMKPEAVSDIRTTGRVDKAVYKALLEKLNDPGMPTGRPRYQDFLQADRRLLRDSLGEVRSNQPVSMDVLTFTPGEKPAEAAPG